MLCDPRFVRVAFLIYTIYSLRAGNFRKTKGWLTTTLVMLVVGNMLPPEWPDNSSGGWVFCSLICLPRGCYLDFWHKQLLGNQPFKVFGGTDSTSICAQVFVPFMSLEVTATQAEIRVLLPTGLFMANHLLSGETQETEVKVWCWLMNSVTFKNFLSFPWFSELLFHLSLFHLFVLSWVTFLLLLLSTRKNISFLKSERENF